MSGSVPEQLYEAAAIDGASALQKLFFVTLPMMRNIIAITVLFSLIVTFADFDIVRILTAGGPQDMTHVFATYAFQVGIQSGDIPLGAADSLFMFPILAFAAQYRSGGLRSRRRGNTAFIGAGCGHCGVATRRWACSSSCSWCHLSTP
jgi:multiple sugar transport system permease protein